MADKTPDTDPRSASTEAASSRTASPGTAAADVPGDAERLGGAGRGPAQKPGERGGHDGPEPTRFGDWEINGRCSDF